MRPLHRHSSTSPLPHFTPVSIGSSRPCDSVPAATGSAARASFGPPAGRKHRGNGNGPGPRGASPLLQGTAVHSRLAGIHLRTVIPGHGGCRELASAGHPPVGAAALRLSSTRTLNDSNGVRKRPRTRRIRPPEQPLRRRLRSKKHSFSRMRPDTIPGRRRISVQEYFRVLKNLLPDEWIPVLNSFAPRDCRGDSQDAGPDPSGIRPCFGRLGSL